MANKLKIDRMHIEIPAGSAIRVFGMDDGDKPETAFTQTFTLTKPLVVWMETEAEGELVDKVYTAQKP